MKECPKLPMLYFEFKSSSTSPDLATPIKKFIREYYGDDGEQYNKEIKELDNLRNAALHPSHDMTGCLILKRYYAQLYTLNNKVKIMKGNLDAKFTWTDIYTGHSVTGDIQFELDCILYNIGALHAELGALNMRDNAENLRIACTHFQCAVWAFEQLKEHPQNKSKDMYHDIISFIYQTMMAQAQECILEKSMLDNRKSLIVARVAAQVIEYYNNALSVLIQASLNADVDVTEIVGSKLFKEWKKFAEFKISYFSAVCALYMGDSCEEQQKTGEQIAWYISGEQHLEQAEKMSKTMGKAEISFLSKTLARKKEVAERDNDFVYHQPVPSSDKLTAVKGAPLVSGVGFNVSDPEVCGKDIFARLVPIEAHEMASIYSENKDSILRNMRAKVEEKDEELFSYLSSLQLDKDNLRPIANTVPDELIEVCAELSVKPTICKDVRKQFQTLEELAGEVSKSIEEASKLISEEEEKEKRYQDKFGKRAPSLIIVELAKELKKHEETHKRGLVSNQNLSQALDKYSKDIQLLIDCSAKDLEGLLPPLTDIPFDEANIKEIEKLLDKVNEMRNQRIALEKQLREAIQSDDVLKHVIAHSKDEIEEIFEKELKKYDQNVNLLEQNMAAQENILNALTKASASYGKSRMALNEVNRLRSSRIASLMNSYQGFMQVKDNIEKGIEVYQELSSITGKLLTRLKSVIKVQDEERLQFVEVQIKKETSNLSNLSLASKRLSETPSPIVSGGAPKLKDYLPYMTNYRANPIATAAAPVPSVIPPSQPQPGISQQYSTPGPTSSIQPQSITSSIHSQTPLTPYYQNGGSYEPLQIPITNNSMTSQPTATSVVTSMAQANIAYAPYGGVPIPQEYPQNPQTVTSHLPQISLQSQHLNPHHHSQISSQTVASHIPGSQQSFIQSQYQPQITVQQQPSTIQSQAKPPQSHIQPAIPPSHHQSQTQHLPQGHSIPGTISQVQPSYSQTYTSQPSNLPPTVNSYQQDYYYQGNQGYYQQQQQPQSQPQMQVHPQNQPTSQHSSQSQAHQQQQQQQLAAQNPASYQFQQSVYPVSGYSQPTYSGYPPQVQGGYQDIYQQQSHQQLHLQQMTSLSDPNANTVVPTSYNYDKTYQPHIYNYNNQINQSINQGMDRAYDPASFEPSLDKHVPLNPIPATPPVTSTVTVSTTAHPSTNVPTNGNSDVRSVELSTSQDNQPLPSSTSTSAATDQPGPGEPQENEDNASKDILCQFDPLWA